MCENRRLAMLHASVKSVCLHLCPCLDRVPSLQVPRRFYFGRQVAVTDRSIIKQYELPARRYLGPTSMEAEMAFLMCNQARVRGWSNEEAQATDGVHARCIRWMPLTLAVQLGLCARHCPSNAHTTSTQITRSPQVGRGSLVFDPFVGTGSILVAAAHRGARTLGTDIDMRVLKLGACNIGRKNVGMAPAC